MVREDVVEVWDLSLNFLYTEKYIKNLIEFLRGHQVKSILDCACGTGFPSIQLAKAGFEMICTDGSKSMIKHFRNNIKKNNIEIPNHILDWRHLSILNKEFDAVLCRGNSLVYVDSWDSKPTIKETQFIQNISKALNQMYKRLKPNGILYIDVTNQEEYDQGPKITETFPEKQIYGGPMTLTWEISHDWKSKIRHVHSIRTFNHRTYEHDYYSFLIKHDDLIDLLKKQGFSQATKQKIEGENNYDIIIATK